MALMGNWFLEICSHPFRHSPHQSPWLLHVTPPGATAFVVPLLISNQGAIVAFITLFKSLIMLTFCVDFSLCDYPIVPVTLATDSPCLCVPCWQEGIVPPWWLLWLTAHVVILGEPAIEISLSSPGSEVWVRFCVCEEKGCGECRGVNNRAVCSSGTSDCHTVRERMSA